MDKTAGQIALNLMLTITSVSHQVVGHAWNNLGQSSTIKLDSVLDLESYFPFALGKIEMGNGFGNCKSALGA